MSKENESEPAFPGTGLAGPHYGMSLRDYFAAQVIGHLVCAGVRQDMTTENDAAYAYDVADAMLAERCK